MSGRHFNAGRAERQRPLHLRVKEISFLIDGERPSTAREVRPRLKCGRDRDVARISFTGGGAGTGLDPVTRVTEA
jgi:hypothetical protein